MKHLMLTCRGASRLLSKGQEQPLCFREQWALKVHLFFCVSCRRYARQLRWMDKTIRLLAGKWSTYRLSAAAKARIRATLKNADSFGIHEHCTIGENRMNKKPRQQASLAEQLQQTKADFLSAIPADIQEVLASASAPLAQAHMEQYALQTGSIAPEFCLPNVHDRTICLRDVLPNGPVVISFYRGGWCPYCSLELRALQQCHSEISTLGASLLAISPQLPDRSHASADEHQLSFEVLSDIGNRVARNYGLVFTVPEELRPIYQQWGIDLPSWNGDDSWELPMPATFVLDRKGVVRAAFVQMDYTQRMDPADIIAALRAIE